MKMLKRGATVEEIPRMVRWLRGTLTQADVASQCDIGRTSVTNIEKGRYVPPVDTLAQIFAACGYQLEIIAIPIAEVNSTDDLENKLQRRDEYVAYLEGEVVRLERKLKNIRSAISNLGE